MENLDLLLIDEEPSEEPRRENGNGLDAVHITRYAYEKAFRYAKLVMERKNRSVEVGGFLTTPKDAKDRVARDAFLARDQEVRVGFYELSAKNVLKAKKELEKKGRKVIGWWHSHGRFKTFHSNTDNKNQMVLLNQIAPSNYVSQTQERTYDVRSRVEGKTLVFYDPINSDRAFHLDLKNGAPELVAERLKIITEKRTGFAYSFVVNHHRWLPFRAPYCEVATREVCSDCMQDNSISRRTGYKIFEEGEFNINDDELITEIDERVHLFGQRAEKTYFLPQVFEEKRASGVLERPNFGSTGVYSLSPSKPLWSGLSGLDDLGGYEK